MVVLLNDAAYNDGFQLGYIDNESCENTQACFRPVKFGEKTERAKL